jgi:hypothetical protein
MTHELEINGKHYLLVGVEECSSDSNPTAGKSMFHFDTGELSFSIVLPSNFSYTAINTISNLTEEECQANFGMPKSEFISLLKSKGILAKSFEDAPPIRDLFGNMSRAYVRYTQLPEELIIIQRI